MKILLLCAGGLSTSILVSRMKKELSENEKDWVIEAHPVENLPYLIDKFDVILLGSQIVWREKAIKKEFSHKNVPMVVIPNYDYAIGNGKKLLDLAKQAYKEW